MCGRVHLCGHPGAKVGRGHDIADPVGVFEQPAGKPPEFLVVGPGERPAVPDQDQLLPRPGDGYVETAALLEEPDRATPIATGEAVHDDVAFLSLEGVDRADA